MKINFKYFIHCLAFFCIPLIIIRGVDLFRTTQKNKKNEQFVPTPVSKITTLWIGEYKETLLIFTPNSNSQELNNFNDKITSELINKDNLKFGFLYVINFGEEEQSVNLENIKISISSKEKTLHNVVIHQNVADTSLYLSILLQNGIIPSKHWKKFLFAFSFSEKMLDIESLQIVWNEKIPTKKITCMRKQFYEFLESPKINYFSTNDKNQ